MKTDKIARYVWIGKRDLNWYQEAESLFTQLFGREKLKLVTQLFAATSINTSLKANITLFRKALDELENDKPIGNYLPNIKKQLEQIRAGKPLTGRKINSFANAMAGDPDAVVVDIWLLRAFDMDRKYFRLDKDQREQEPIGQAALEVDVYQTITDIKKQGRFRSSGATNGEYTKIENYVRQEAKAMGIEARQLSALIWSGVRIDQSGDRETHYATLLRQSLFNMFEAVTLRDWLYDQQDQEDDEAGVYGPTLDARPRVSLRPSKNKPF